MRGKENDRAKASSALNRIIDKLILLRDNDCRGISTPMYAKAIEMLSKSVSMFVSEAEDMPINKACERYNITKEGLRQRVKKHRLPEPKNLDEPVIKVYPRETIEQLDNIYPHN